MNRAFSLVELSIVLVILGLLVGGILAGQSLIRAAELRSVSTEYSRYLAAVNSFRDKYFALPGDMANASSFWGLSTACAGAVATGTCNGDANGQMAYGGGASATGEVFQFWRQLALAGLIEGNYSGLAGSGGAGHAVIGTNVPASKLATAGWRVGTHINYPGSVESYAMDYGNDLLIGAPVANSTPYNPAMKPEEAWNIDTKIDDGKPASGNIIAVWWNNACSAADDGTHTNNDLVASYKLSDNTIQCALYFRKLF